MELEKGNLFAAIYFFNFLFYVFYMKIYIYVDSKHFYKAQ